VSRNSWAFRQDVALPAYENCPVGRCVSAYENCPAVRCTPVYEKFRIAGNAATMRVSKELLALSQNEC